MHSCNVGDIAGSHHSEAQRHQGEDSVGGVPAVHCPQLARRVPQVAGRRGGWKRHQDTPPHQVSWIQRLHNCIFISILHRRTPQTQTDGGTAYSDYRRSVSNVKLKCRREARLSLSRSQGNELELTASLSFSTIVSAYLLNHSVVLSTFNPLH